MKGIRVVADFPRKVREIENLWIPMPDGININKRFSLDRLTPRMWRTLLFWLRSSDRLHIPFIFLYQPPFAPSTLRAFPLPSPA